MRINLVKGLGEFLADEKVVPRKIWGYIRTLTEFAYTYERTYPNVPDSVKNVLSAVNEKLEPYYKREHEKYFGYIASELANMYEEITYDSTSEEKLKQRITLEIAPLFSPEFSVDQVVNALFMHKGNIKENEGAKKSATKALIPLFSVKMKMGENKIMKFMSNHARELDISEETCLLNTDEAEISRITNLFFCSEETAKQILNLLYKEKTSG
jgi:hypothetical protein